MKKTHLALTKTGPQAKPNSREARQESLPARIRTGRSVKAMTGAAILSTVLWLAGCNAEQGEEPKNPDTDTANADNSSEQLNQQERGAGAKLQFKAETAEQAEQVGHRAIYSMLKGSLEQLLRDNDTVFKSGEEAEEFVGTELGAFFDEVISNRKEGVLENIDPEAIETNKIYVDWLYNELEDNSQADIFTATVYRQRDIEGKKLDESVVLYFEGDGFEFPSDEASARKMINAINTGKVTGLTPVIAEYASSEGIEEALAWNSAEMNTQDPRAALEQMNMIWDKYAKITGDRNPNIVENIPDISTEEIGSGTGDSELESGGEPEGTSGSTPQDQSEVSTPDETSPELSPAQVLALQYEHINSGDYEAAYELFAEESQEIVSLAQYRAFFEDLGYYQLTDYSFPSVDVQGDSAVVEVNFTSETPNGEGQFQPVQQMVLEDGEWRAVMRDDQIEAFTETG